MTTALTVRTRQRLRSSSRMETQARPAGMPWVLCAEAVATGLGFVALVHQARRLGPESFARVEYGAAVAAWLLVLVRGGLDVIVYREAARRPRLIGPLTDLLVGLRLVAACVGYGFVLAIAGAVGGGRSIPIAAAGLVLLASAWVCDVGPRATGRLGWVAILQAVRAIGLVTAVLGLVRGPGDAVTAVACLVVAEGVVAVVSVWDHARHFGVCLPRLRRRACLVLVRRGVVAGLLRFVRVTLYAADILALGWWAGEQLGPYVAARRVVFALVALGLVVPATLAPWFAAGWAQGVEEARGRVGSALGWLWSLSLPAAVGLALTAGRWMPVLFGESYREGGPWLALVAARLPWLLAASFHQTAAVACRREGLGLRLVLLQAALASVLIPAGAFWGGPLGVGWAALMIEMVGAVAGWVALRRLGVAPGWPEQTGRAMVGSLGLIAACRLFREAPLPVICLTAAFGYGAAWRAAARLGSFRTIVREEP